MNEVYEAKRRMQLYAYRLEAQGDLLQAYIVVEGIYLVEDRLARLAEEIDGVNAQLASTEYRWRRQPHYYFMR